jgi:arylsulfatase
MINTRNRHAARESPDPAQQGDPRQLCRRDQETGAEPGNSTANTTSKEKRSTMVNTRRRKMVVTLLMAFGLATVVNTVAHAQEKKPNIVFIMGDDIGWFNIGAYHQGIMAGRTPNLDKLAAEGMRFIDYYAEASCTAGRANFITGEIPIRTGLTTVGQAGQPCKGPLIMLAERGCARWKYGNGACH